MGCKPLHIVGTLDLCPCVPTLPIFSANCLCLQPEVTKPTNTKLKKLDVQKSIKDKLFADYATPVCEVHNWVIVSFLQQVQGGVRPTAEGSKKNIGQNVHV